MFQPNDVVQIKTMWHNAIKKPLTVLESNYRHTLVAFSDGSEEWYDTIRLELV